MFLGEIFWDKWMYKDVFSIDLLWIQKCRGYLKTSKLAIQVQWQLQSVEYWDQENIWGSKQLGLIAFPW